MTQLPDSLIPSDDAQRLRSLHHYQIHNTTPELIFDAFVELAAQLFNLPISLISLVDEQQVFFKANTGMPGLERIGRADSLCSAAVLQNEVLTYTDLATESCQLVNPETAEAAGLRFYAGAALQMTDGNNIGSMCVMGREPRTISPDEVKLLKALADLVSRTIALRWHYLSRGRTSDWLVVQAELQVLLHDQAAMARYLTARLGTLTSNKGELDAARRRLNPLSRELTKHLVEFV